MPDFGSPPSGEYPILFNDHHVYAKPDLDKKGRVLAALVRGKTILVPLRSMFEQMGADVSYDPATRTAVVSKPGSEIRVTVGKPEVVINGESRPLDVPPEIDNGSVLVPVRVISEAMGAYVQWVAEKRAVVVRYVPVPAPPPPPPPPAPAPTATPAPPPPPVLGPPPTPAPMATPYYEKFIAVDYIGWPKVYNEFASGTQNVPSWNVHAAAELSSPVLHLMFEGNFNRWQFIHPNVPVTIIGRNAAVATPSFNGHEDDSDINFGMRIAQPRIYFIEGYFFGANNYGYPNLHGLGFGLEKLPDLDRPISFEARYFYAQQLKGPFAPITVGATTYPGGTLSYRMQQWKLGFDWSFSSRGFAQLGYQGEGWIPFSNAPSPRNYIGPYIGLGAHF